MGNNRSSIDKLIPEIIRLHNQGENNKRIAKMLNISRTSVARRLANCGMHSTKKHIAGGCNEKGGITENDIACMRNRIEVGQLIMCEVEAVDRDSSSTQLIPVLRNMYVVKKMMNGRGMLVSNNPGDTLGKLITYSDIIQLRRRLMG